MIHVVSSLPHLPPIYTNPILMPCLAEYAKQRVKHLPFIHNNIMLLTRDLLRYRLSLPCLMKEVKPNLVYQIQDGAQAWRLCALVTEVDL